MDVTLRRILIFLGVTFALTWAYEFMVVWPAATGGLGDVPAAAVQLIVAVVMFFPAIGVVVTRLVTREGFFGSSLLAPVDFRRTWKYWLLGWFGPSVLVLAGAALYFALNPADFDPSMSHLAALLEAQAAQTGATIAPDQVILVGVAQLATGVFLAPALNIATTFGEEWGWRGYLLPKLLERRGILPTLLLSGVIWGLWHAPLTMAGHNYGVGYVGFPFAGILAMCGFCVVTGVFMSYVTLRSGSCLPAAFAHGALNGMVNAGIMFSVSGGDPFVGPAPTGILGGAALIACGVVMAVLLRRQEKRGGDLLLRRRPAGGEGVFAQAGESAPAGVGEHASAHDGGLPLEPAEGGEGEAFARDVKERV